MRAFQKSASCAWHGISQAFDKQRNIKIISCCAVLALVLGPACGLSAAELAVIALACGLVLALEIANTALENLADALHPEHHPQIGRAKDLMAGAVLMASFAAALVGLILFGNALLW